MGVSVSGARAAEVCVTNALGPDICVDFDLGTPVEDTHFDVDHSNPANPGVRLITGAAWNVRSDDNGSAGNIGAIQIHPNAGFSADVGGVLNVSAGGRGSIINGGTVKPGGRVTLANGNGFGTTGAFSGKAEFRRLEWVPLPGPKSFIRTIHGADLAGTITVAESIDGPVEIDGMMTSTGRILIEGTCNGPIRIGEDTEKYSLIHVLGGIADNGRITINANEGNFNAHGDIHVGPGRWTQLPNVTFTGCIRVRNEFCNAAPCPGGDLRGDITAVGCHAGATPDLNICVEGTTYGSIAILQAGCVYPVGLDDSYTIACPQ